MPKSEYTSATYVPHANGYTVRPTINGKRYFIGYWETEAEAIRNANAFRRRAEYTTDEQELASSARELQTLAREANEIRRRHQLAEPKPVKLTLSARVEALEQRMRRLEAQLQETQV